MIRLLGTLFTLASVVSVFQRVVGNRCGSHGAQFLALTINNKTMSKMEQWPSSLFDRNLASASVCPDPRFPCCSAWGFCGNDRPWCDASSCIPGNSYNEGSCWKSSKVSARLYLISLRSSHIDPAVSCAAARLTGAALLQPGSGDEPRHEYEDHLCFGRLEL